MVGLDNRLAKVVRTAIQLATFPVQNAERLVGHDQATVQVDVAGAASNIGLKRCHLSLPEADCGIERAAIAFAVRRPAEQVRHLFLIGHVLRIDGGDTLHRLQCGLEESAGLIEAALAAQDDAEILVGVERFHPPFEIVGPDGDHLPGELFILAICGFRAVEVAALARQLTEPEDILGMVEQPLRIAGRAVDRFAGAGQRLAIEALRLVEIAAQISHAGHQVQRLRPLQQGRIRQLAGILLFIVAEDPRADSVKRIEPADGLQLGPEVAEHVADQALRLPALVARGVAGGDRGDCQRAGHCHSGDRGGGEQGQAAVTAGGVALDKVVQANAGHSCDELQKPIAPAIPRVAQIGGQWFGHLPGRPAAPVVMGAQRRRQAFFRLASRDVAGERRPVDDGGQHAAIGPEPLEGIDLGIDPARPGRRRRAKDDQEARCRQRFANFGTEIGCRGQLAPVPEDRFQPTGHDAILAELAGDRRGHVEAFELFVQPFGHRLVGMAVAQEGIIKMVAGSGADCVRRRFMDTLRLL